MGIAPSKTKIAPAPAPLAQSAPRAPSDPRVLGVHKSDIQGDMFVPQISKKAKSMVMVASEGCGHCRVAKPGFIEAMIKAPDQYHLFLLEIDRPEANGGITPEDIIKLSHGQFKGGVPFYMTFDASGSYAGSYEKDRAGEAIASHMASM